VANRQHLPAETASQRLALSLGFLNNLRHPKGDSAMRARIYQPAKTAMQSGTAKTKGWVLEFDQASERQVDPLMGWTSSNDTQTQVKLRFDSRDDALAYAQAKGIEVVVQEPKARKPIIRAGGYGENFATNRRGAWTH
jgi:hypothetical protein